MHNLSLNEKLTYILFIALTIKMCQNVVFKKIHILCLIEMRIEMHRISKHENA